MFFRIVGVKEELDNKYQIDIIVESISQLLVRKIFEEHQIVIISLAQYEKTPEEFGHIQFTIQYNNQPVKCIVPGEDVQAVCFLYMKLDFDVVYINTLDNQLNKEAIDQLLVSTKQKISEAEQEQEDFLKDKEVEQQKMYEDKKLVEIKELLQNTLDVIDEIQQRTAQYVAGDKLKHLRSLRDELSKIRLGTNKAKMRDFLGQIYKLTEQINKEFFSHPDVIKQQQRVFEESLVTDLEVFSEEIKFAKSQLVKQLSLEQSLNDKYYLFVGRMGMFVKFLKKDLFHFFRDWKYIVYKLYDVFEYLFGAIITLSVIVLVINEKFLNMTANFSAYYMLMGWGLFAFLFHILKQYIYKHQYKNILLLVGAIPVLFIIYLISWNILRHSFAL